MVTGAYKPRNPKASALYQCVQAHFAGFEEAYPTRYQEQYGFYRPVIGRVVEKFLACGDLTKGFARVRCDTCRHEYLLAFSCKGRYFCPSCHQKRVLQFGNWVADEVLGPVPHRQYVFTVPKMLRVYHSKMHPVLKRNFEVFTACDWLAALTAHIPNAGEHLVRYYGWYSNVSRGKRRKTQGEDPSTIEGFTEVSDTAAKRAWARLIKQGYEVDPLVCPRCAGPMRIIAFIEQPAVIEKILTHLRLWPAPAHSPPAEALVA